MIGNSVVTFDKDDIIIGANEYEGTPGLYELLFMKNPEKSQITEVDKENYRKILSDSKTIYRHYSTDKQIQGIRAEKYRNFISPYVKQRRHSTKEGGLLKDFVTARPNYIYWNDVNELVDRLRLLLASKDAGHSGHDNEIISIIEELREQDLIY